MGRSGDIRGEGGDIGGESGDIRGEGGDIRYEGGDVTGDIRIHRRYQPRGENEVGYQHECRADPSAGPEGAHEGQPNKSVDPDPSSFPKSLVLLLSFLSASKE